MCQLRRLLEKQPLLVACTLLGWGAGIARAQVDRDGALALEAPSARVVVSAAPVNIMREANPDNLADSAYYVVFRDLLADVPIMVEVSLTLRPSRGQATLTTDTATWASQFRFNITMDSKPAECGRLQLVDRSVRVSRWTDGVAEGHVAAGNVLRPGEILTSVWEFRGDRNADLAPGFYEIRLHPAPTAGAHFQAAAEFQADFRIAVVQRSKGDDDRFREDRIEGHYLTASALKDWDAPARQRHLLAAKRLVEDYLASGAGDEEGLFNVTPRYQAARIHAALGERQEAIAFYTQVLQAVARESKMRLAHFGRESGLLPENYADNLIRAVKRLRDSEPGRPPGTRGAP